MKHKIIFSILFFTTISAAEQLDKITIEATKLNDNNSAASQSTDFLDEDKLKTLHINSIENLSSIISNANISGIGNRDDKTFSIRGISNYVAYESSVVVYVDDAPVPFSYGYGAIDFKNIQSIEFLKGPQETRFGKSAQSGAINIYTKTPTDKFTNQFSIGYGAYNSKDLYGFVSGPLNSKDLSGSFSVTKSTSDGYAKNDLTAANMDTKDLSALSIKLNYHPSSALNIALAYSKTVIDDGGSAFKVNTKNNIRNIDNEPSNDFVKMDTDLVSLKLKFKADNYNFTSISTYSKERISKQNYVALTNVLGSDLLISTDTHIAEAAQEFRLNYNFENADLLLGMFYSYKPAFDYKENQKLLKFNLNSLNSLQNPDEIRALFSQYKYYINNNYYLTAGLRYQESKRDFSRDLNRFLASTTHAKDSTTSARLLPSLSLSHASRNNSNTYLSYSQGYRAKGYNYRTSDTLVPFKPESVESFELGHKITYGSLWTLNSAIFYNKIKDLRIISFDDTLTTTTLNAQKAHSYGAEIEANYKSDIFALYATSGFTRANIDEFSADKSYEGNKIIDVPNITASIGGKYNLLKNYYLQSSVKYMGERYYNITNSAKENGYTTVNFGVGYTKKDLNILLYANNLFDAKYSDFMIATPTNNYYHFGAPRVIGLSMDYSF